MNRTYLKPLAEKPHRQKTLVRRQNVYEGIKSIIFASDLLRCCFKYSILPFYYIFIIFLLHFYYNFIIFLLFFYYISIIFLLCFFLFVGEFSYGCACRITADAALLV